MNPKVFVSHASEDKERFVLNFATKLKENGVDAWLDKWEMLPGDSLVEKIFEEGLKEAKAVIIVLSEFSVNKPWVKEELNTSVVNRINKGTKIIPVVLDNCEVPESLVSTLWEGIKDLDNYDKSFDRILHSIFGFNDKPELGKVPVYANITNKQIFGLSKIDSLILKNSCDLLLKSDGYYINPEELLNELNESSLPKDEIEDSIKVLESKGYFDVTWFLGSEEFNFIYKVSCSGFEEYSRTYINDYENLIKKSSSLIINENMDNNYQIQESLNQPIYLVNHILEMLELYNLLTLSKLADGSMFIYNPSPLIKRALANNESIY